MRNVTGWGAAAMVAALAGCSGGNEVKKEDDEHLGPDEVCKVCKATGGGTFIFDDTIWTFGVNAIPTPNGVVGHIELHGHQDTNIFGVVTGITCERVDHNLIATITGTEGQPGEEPRGPAFTLVVMDAGEPGRSDTFSYTDSTTIPETALERGGNLQVRELNRCRPPPPVCEPGFCVCPDNNQCEPCPEDPPPTVQPL